MLVGLSKEDICDCLLIHLTMQSMSGKLKSPAAVSVIRLHKLLKYIMSVLGDLHAQITIISVIRQIN